MAVPALTTQERQAALEKAAKARHDRAELLKSIKAGKIDPAGVLLRQDHNPIVERTRVRAFIEAWPGYGRHKAEALMFKIGISPQRRIGGLGANQRQALLDVLASKKAQEK